jgi:dolichol-phosphate mannosyltransferase
LIPDSFKLSVIMPVYNERSTALRVLDRVLAVPIHKEVILVDNCSTDGTRDILSSIHAEQVRVILHPANLGRGTSVRTGLEYCSGDYTITQGADLEYDPEEWPLLIEKALAGDLDAVFGSRTLGGRRVYIYAQNYYGILFFNALINLLYGSHYTDSGTECKMIRTPVYRALGLQCSGFDLDFEICARLALHGCAYGEVPISYHPRSMAQGKKLRAVAALRVVLRERFAWRRVEYKPS